LVTELNLGIFLGTDCDTAKPAVSLIHFAGIERTRTDPLSRGVTVSEVYASGALDQGRCGRDPVFIAVRQNP